MHSLGKFLQRNVVKSTFNPALAQATMRFACHNNHHEHSPFPYHVKARVQFPAPNFEAMAYNVDGFKKVSLADFKGKYVVVFTYPLDFTFVCPTEIIEFNDKAEEFRKIGKLRE